MINYYLSVRLASCCCNCNYLQRVCRMGVKVLQGRKYEFMWSEYALTALLYCNGVNIGIIRKDTLRIHSQFSVLIPSRSYLYSVLAMFNLYPC